MRVLVAEDEPKVARALREGLEDEGFDVVVEHSGREALTRIGAERFDVVLLDLTLPQCDGLEILATMRNGRIHTPVLILTARDSVRDRVLGLDGGADDYLVKPFAFDEVLARIRALLRRGRSVSPAALEIADLRMDRTARSVTRDGSPIDLTSREFDLLEYLLQHRGQVVARPTLARDVWRETFRATPLDNVIDVHIARLRRKIDTDRAVRLIHTVRGVGFIVREGDR